MKKEIHCTIGGVELLREEVEMMYSQKLNNTASVCKTSYIDPYLWDYMYDVAFPEKQK